MAGMDWTDWTDTFLLALELSRVEVGTEFSLEQVYKLEPILKKIYPKNSNIRSKIRQQLQILRDHERILFLDNQGHYRRIN
tara:strand:+ start:1152 stop:1394 length:243 start_codon:yes stop_codon:yes gene_type:complete